MSEPGIRERAREELRSYAVIAAYLYACLAVLVLYEDVLLRQEGGRLLPHGIAAIKALVLGKFILIGEAVGVGTRLGATTLAARVAVRSLLMLMLLVVLTVIEELVVGAVHGHSLAETLAEYERRSLLAMAAKCLLTLLILVPLITAKEISRALGPGVLRRILSQPGH